MKKSTNPAEGAPPEKSARKHGPDKEKTQLTVRIDQDVMAQASEVMKRTNMRITDMLERGLQLAIHEENQDLPWLTSQVRFLVHNTTKAEQEQLWDFLTFMRAAEVARLNVAAHLGGEAELVLRRFIQEYLKTFRPLRSKVKELYARYARTEEEMAQLTANR
jgi:antitoxin component of RelBE/YafQ-DinJ toxin-antitoxin module